ncbi:fumarylacetoacetate hydrolase family protein [Amycolatopsis dongchuanensis]|uniref:Fumarylacetoacetate hydrolase family protein n=1 Tax=Amycolatopsis dongchuanensis TaxID=1070866 RepID=A0ABP9Q980_9PSEU
MKLATLRTAEGTRAVRVEGDRYAELGAPHVGAWLSQEDWRARAEAITPERPLAGADLAPVVPRPGKILCVGLNYRTHILEMGRELPRHPTLFAKFPEALIGPADPIALPPESDAVDWEAELAVVLGATVRRASEAEAAGAIAGFSVLNDITTRDWQYRSPEWLQGKTFEGTTPFGPYLVTPDELPGGTRPALDLSCSVDGEQVQKAGTDDLVFDPVQLVRYASTIVTLRPGDVIATGTPGGVGHARKPPRYLSDGVRVVTEISGLGRLENVARDERP